MTLDYRARTAARLRISGDAVQHLGGWPWPGRTIPSTATLGEHNIAGKLAQKCNSQIMSSRRPVAQHSSHDEGRRGIEFEAQACMCRYPTPYFVVHVCLYTANIL